MEDTLDPEIVAISSLEVQNLDEIPIDIEPEGLVSLTLEESDPDVLREKIAAGEIEGAKVMADAVKLDHISGEKLTLDEVREMRRGDFEPPRSEPLFDEEGEQIGVRAPDQVVFDGTGNPIGKRPGDLVAIDESGAVDTEAVVPDVFYLKDRTGEDKIHATTFYNAFVPKASVVSNVGEKGEKPINLSTFASDGRPVPSIIQFDPDGNPVGAIPMEGDLKILLVKN